MYTKLQKRLCAITMLVLILISSVACQFQDVDSSVTTSTTSITISTSLSTSNQTSVTDENTLSTLSTTLPQVIPGTSSSTASTTESEAPVTTTKPQTTTVNTTLITTTNGPVEDPNPRKKVAFSFDDGPHNTLTYKFVDKLMEYGATASFFVVGDRITKKGGAAIKYAYDHGCEIGLHSYDHEIVYNSNCSDSSYLEDLERTANAINAYVPGEIRLMRPPGGTITTSKVEMCPYSVILWSVDSNDWRYKKRTTEEEAQTNIQIIVDNVMSEVGEGDIVLMHELYENSYEAFCIIIERLYADGYEIVSVSELLGDKLQPGKKYYSN